MYNQNSEACTKGACYRSNQIFYQKGRNITSYVITPLRSFLPLAGKILTYLEAMRSPMAQIVKTFAIGKTAILILPSIDSPPCVSTNTSERNLFNIFEHDNQSSYIFRQKGQNPRNLYTIHKWGNEQLKIPARKWRIPQVIGFELKFVKWTTGWVTIYKYENLQYNENNMTK